MLKKPLTFKEQVKKLENHGVEIDNPLYVEKVLEEVNYYRLSGYLLEYRKSENDSNLKEKITFDKLYSIYKLDNELKDFLFRLLIQIELNLRTIISYEFSMSKCKISPHDQHYNKLNYYNKSGFKEVINSVNNFNRYEQNSKIFKHHSEKYSSKMPLWVVIEFMTFSVMSKYYSCMYHEQQNLISNKIGIHRNLLVNWLHCLSVLRNYCAHGARICNVEFKPSVKLGRTFLRKNPDVKNNSLFSYIYIVFKLLPKSLDKKEELKKLFEILDSYPLVEKEKLGFPINYKNLLNK